MMFCPECGTKNEEDARFCEGCGKELKGPNVMRVRPHEASVPVTSIVAISKRPLPIVLIAIYFTLTGIISVILNLVILVPGMVLGSAVSDLLGASEKAPFLLKYGSFIFLLVEFLSILCLASVYGLWNFLQWGRILAIGVSVIFLIFSFVRLTDDVLTGIISIVIHAAIIWYLIMSDTSQRFVE